MQIALGNYYTGNSILHRLDARVKLLAVLVLMVVIFFLTKVISIFLFGVIIVILARLAKIPLTKLIKSVRAVLFFAVFAWLINIFSVPGDVIWQWSFLKLTQQGLIVGTMVAVRLFYLVLSSTLLLTAVTTPIAVADALERLLQPLTKFGFPAHELALIMSIALRYVPLLIVEMDKIMKAQVSRGADFDTGGLIARIRGLVTVLVPLFISAFKRAADLALAMEARCYRGGDGRTKLNPLIMRKHDWWFVLIANLVIIALLIADKFYFTI